MYIKKITIKNIRSITNLTWTIPAKNSLSGWHVILGDNGAGKSTLLRAIALAMIGIEDARILRQNWDEWLTYKQVSGSIRMEIRYDSDFDRLLRNENVPVKPFLQIGYKFKRQWDKVNLEKIDPEHRDLGKKGGWFSAAYGPFRRFTGGDEEFERISDNFPRLAAHLSLFFENHALNQSINWLKDLQFKKLENRQGGQLIDLIKTFINQEEFLPNQVRLESVSSEGVEFVDGNGCQISVDNLSDGYRSVLSMTFELIRQLSKTYGEERVFNKFNTYVDVPGVVLIDEIDAHLHPSWQKQVGVWFQKYFPKIQFIVTTHSPLICQSAESGAIYRLPQPGSDGIGGLVKGDALQRLLYGNVLEAYGTELFGQDVTRSDAARGKLDRLAMLNRKELNEELNSKEQTEQQKLRATFPTSASITKSDGVVK